MTNDYNTFSWDESQHLDRKSLDSKTKFTATTMSSNDSFSEKKKLDSLNDSKDRPSRKNPSSSNKYSESFESGYESPTSKESESVARLISSLRRSKYNIRAKSAPRPTRTPTSSRYLQKNNFDTGVSRTYKETPRKYHDYSKSPMPRRPIMTNDYSEREISSAKHREKLIDLIARDDMGKRNGNMEHLRSRSRSRLRELVSREEELSSAMLRNNVRDMIEDEMERHDNYMYGKYNRREKSDHYKESSRSSDRRQKEKISNLTFKNEDLKKKNYKLKKEIEDLKVRMGQSIEYSMFFTEKENSKGTSDGDSLQNMAMKVSKLQHEKTNLESEIDELKEAVKDLEEVIQGHEETIQVFRDQEDEHVFALQEKNELIFALEKDKETLRQYLLETQIENKILRKKTGIMEKKMEQIQISTDKGRERKKNSNKQGLLYVHPPPPDENTVSSLEDM